MKKILFIICLAFICISCIDNSSKDIIGAIVYEKRLDNDWDPVIQNYVTHKNVCILVESKFIWVTNERIFDEYNEDDSILFEKTKFTEILKIIDK